MKKEKNITTDFSKFNQKKIDKQQKTGVFQPLSDDITAVFKNDKGEYEKIEGPVEIVKVLDIVKDEKEIKKIEEVASTPVVNTDISLKTVKRGDIIYVTALLEKPGSKASWTSQTMGVLKCRIVDFYYGLNILNQVMNK